MDRGKRLLRWFMAREYTRFDVVQLTILVLAWNDEKYLICALAIFIGPIVSSVLETWAE